MPFWPGRDPKATWEVVKQILTVLLPAETSLVGPVVGFYFGSRTASQYSEADSPKEPSSIQCGAQRHDGHPNAPRFLACEKTTLPKVRERPHARCSLRTADRPELTEVEYALSG
jgi:hypothetical protein